MKIHHNCSTHGRFVDVKICKDTFHCSRLKINNRHCRRFTLTKRQYGAPNRSFNWFLTSFTIRTFIETPIWKSFLFGPDSNPTKLIKLRAILWLNVNFLDGIKYYIAYLIKLYPVYINAKQFNFLSANHNFQLKWTKKLFNAGENIGTK